ncbi:MAG: sigma-70 family RNA polymerase sigma factor [Pseudomonadota bacterium]
MAARTLIRSATSYGMTRTSTDDDDRALIGRIASQRDAGAFERLYDSYRRRLGPFMFRFVRDTAANEEAFNDIMLTVWRKASSYNGRSRVSTWIFGIAYRQCLKTLRQLKREPGGDDSVEVAVDETRSLERQDLVERALEGLSVEHRLVIELSYFAGHSYQEIAAIADCPENTVKTRVFHARKRLKAIMNELGEQPS